MNDGLKVIDSLGGGGKEKQVADYIVNNNVAPKTAEQMAAVQKYYPNYKAPEVTTGKSAINERFANNVFRGANEVANSFDQINQQGITTGRGILGGVTGKGTISSVLASDLASSLTDEDQVNYNTNVADLGLEMATVLSGGYRVNQSVIDKIQNALQVNPGDTYGNAAYKFATGIRKLKVAVEAQPTYNDTQLKAKNNLLARLDKYATPEQILEKTGKPRVSRQDLQKIAKDKNVSYAEAERLAKRKGYIVIEQFPSLTVEDISKEKTGE